MIQYISLLTTLFVFSYSFSNKNYKPPVKPFVVVLDAGHGGHDSGNRGNGLFEKTIALDIVLKTGAILEQKPNIKVIYTRKTDVFVDLFVRGKIANRAQADLFVSVHCNAHHTKAYGTETFVLGLHANNRNFNIAKKENSVILLEDNYKQNYDGFDPNSPESVIGLTITQEEYLEQSLSLASYVQENFTRQLNRKNRGVKQAGFIVLHQTVMPSVLIETGFLSNKSEGKYLNSDHGKDQMASSISQAILDYQESVYDSFAIDEEPITNAPVQVITPQNKPVIQPRIKTTTTIIEDKKPVKETISSSITSKKETSITKVNVVVEDKKPEIIKTQKVEVVKVKKEVNTPPTPTKTSNIVTSKSVSPIVFRVQLAASRKLINPSPENFRGIPNIEMLEIDDYYKYYFGKTTNYKNALGMRQEARQTGFASCFIVAFENGQPIKLYEALKKVRTSN